MELFCFADRDFFFKWKDSQRPRGATAVSVEMEKTHCSRPGNSPQVTHVPSYCILVLKERPFAWNRCSLAMNHIFFHSKHVKNTLKPLNSIQILMILCNSLQPLNENKELFYQPTCPCVAAALLYYKHVHKKKPHLKKIGACFTMGHSAKHQIPQLVKWTCSFRKKCHSKSPPGRWLGSKLT